MTETSVRRVSRRRVSASGMSASARSRRSRSDSEAESWRSSRRVCFEEKSLEPSKGYWRAQIPIV